MTTRKKGLGEKVAGRIEFLKKVTGFADMICSRRGKKLLYSQGSSHTHTIYELHDFGEFSFYADTGRTMFGGNQVKVWYHPRARYAGGLSPNLDISWQIQIEESILANFDPDPQWQKSILKLIRDQEKIAAQIDRADAAAKKKALADFEASKRAQELVETARRLQVG